MWKNTRFNDDIDKRSSSLAHQMQSFHGYFVVTPINFWANNWTVDEIKRLNARVALPWLVSTWCLGLPTTEGNTALGSSSPAKPALHIPEPLSITEAETSSSHMMSSENVRKMHETNGSKQERSMNSDVAYH